MAQRDRVDVKYRVHRRGPLRIFVFSQSRLDQSPGERPRKPATLQRAPAGDINEPLRFRRSETRTWAARSPARKLPVRSRSAFGSSAPAAAVIFSSTSFCPTI
jgi:hypothetical protein